MKRYLFTLTAAACMVAMAVAAEAASVADARTVAASASLAARLPEPIGFTVSAAGPVSVTLTDLQSQVGFTTLAAVVTQGATKVLAFSAPGTQQFQAAAGDYKIQVVGKVPSAFGLFRVEVRTASNQLLAASTAQIAAGTPVSSGQSPPRYTLQPGTYQVALRDAAFPAALQFADLAVFSVGGSGPLAPISKSSPTDCVAAACTSSFTVSQAGAFDLVVAAAASASAGKGLYTVSLTGPGAAVVAADAYAVGDLPEPSSVTLPVAGDYTLSLADLLAPGAALGELRVLLVQGANILRSLSGEGSVTAPGALAGTAKLFLLSAAGSSGVGAYDLQLRRSTGQLAYETAGIAPEGLNTAQTAAGYRYTVNVPAGADYRLVLRDLQFPAALTTLRAMVVQAGSVNSLGAPGTAAGPLVAGTAFVLVTATKGAASSGMLGVALEPVVAGTALVSKAQGVGALFDTRPVQITAAGAYDLAVSDLQFPVGLSDLAVAVTRGPDPVGQIFGSGGFTFNAQPGEYSVNLLARPATGADYGTWGFALTSTPQPTVTFSASPATVAPQGTATLTWSSTGATGCTASGGWSGTRATSGTFTTAALAVQTLFTITCTGAGGSASASATVAVSTPDGGGGGSGGGGGGGGGGALDPLLLCLALGLLLWKRGIFRTLVSPAPARCDTAGWPAAAAGRPAPAWQPGKSPSAKDRVARRAGCV